MNCFIPLFVLKIFLADTGYIEVQYTMIKGVLANRLSARVTARNPAVWRQGRVLGGRRTPVRSSGFESSLDTNATHEPL